MVSDEDNGEQGIVAAEQVPRKHSDGFDAALEEALRKLNRGGDFNIRLWVSVTPNPGGVSHYGCDLSPRG
jgi:hypothetical protein